MIVVLSRLEILTPMPKSKNRIHSLLCGGVVLTVLCTPFFSVQAQEAVKNFFRKGNLIALRELALRQTANRVDAQMLDYRDDNSIREVWQVNERILVCIGHHALAERLVRAGKPQQFSL